MTLKEIRQKVLEKLKYYKSINDDDNLEKFMLIYDILCQDDALIKLDYQVAINILNDIYMDNEVAKKVYAEIVNQTK